MDRSEAIYPRVGYSPNPNGELGRGVGSVQSYGVLLVLSRFDLTILQTSANALDYFNFLSGEILNQPLTSLFDPDSIGQIQQSLTEASTQPNGLHLALRTIDAKTWDGILHCEQNFVLLELEPTATESETARTAPYVQLRNAIHRIRPISSLTGFLHQSAIEIRALTGFDRVLIYQFDPQGAGKVVAEAKHQELPSYLGLHYPATDIPQQSRQLYAQGLLRHIPDLTALNIALVATENPLTEHLPDLSFVTLRGTDPCCVEYHQNMGVVALLVIALVKDQQLWGLIACHHQTPKRVPYAVRTACDLFGQLIAAELSNKINAEELEAMVKLKALQSELVQSMTQAEDFKAALIQPSPRLLEAVNAQGAAVCLEDEITLIGATPTAEQINDLIAWADGQVNDFWFQTNALAQLYPAAELYKDTASGLLLLRISQVRRYYILWFRPEVLQTVNWAGDPNTGLETNGHAALSPRRSFEQWQETVRLTSESWKSSEIENALDLRNAIVGIVLNKADELAQINRELERSNQELESFAYAASHDLKEPLRGIYNYATFLLEDYIGIIDEAGTERLKTLIRLTQRMEALIDVLLKFAQIGQATLHRYPADLNQLLGQVITIFQISHPQANLEIRVPRPLPTLEVDAVLVSEIFSNLVSNAYKYNDKPHPWVEIGYLTAAELSAPAANLSPSTPVFYVRDNGIGIRERHLTAIFRLFKRLHPQTMYGGGTGAGLTIAKKMVERHGGQIWVESIYTEGSIFYLTLG